MNIPPLGFITVADRTPAQHAAHAAALGQMVRHALPYRALAPGESVRLFDAWKDPDVVADVGMTFTRIHQLTGSCVWAGGTNAVFSSIAMQRVAGDNPTKAFLPFTLHNYAMSRHYMGDDGKGEGSMGSTFAKSLTTDGIRDWASDANLPTYTTSDGISVQSEQVEMDWSTSRNPAIPAVEAVSKAHTFGSASACNSVEDIQAMLQNGYGVTFACDRYIGNASVKGSGTGARVMGKWNGNGGHQQSIHAVENHEQFGPIYWAQNNWPGSTYPADPGGGPVCGCWVLEADVIAALGYNAEVYGLSHLPWFPAQPKVLDWSTI
jgi:hypothetical protein